MSSNFPLRQSLQALQQKMSTDFSIATAQIAHHGAKGFEREKLVLREYLSHYLPKTVVAVHAGQIVDSKGNSSRQCDIVIEDPSTPPLYISETFHLIPVEWAHGVIEVKSRLDNTALRDAHQMIVQAKSLRKLTYDLERQGISFIVTAYGKEYRYFPMYGIVFAYTGISLDILGRNLWELQKDTPPETWIDLVVILDQGILSYSDPAGNAELSVRPWPNSALQVIVSKEPLTPATLVMQVAFSDVFMPHANLNTYFGPEDWGTVTHSFGPK